MPEKSSEKDKAEKKPAAMNGAEAAAYAMKQINPDVVPAYPITPQTHIMESYAQYVADGEVDTEMILAESEHSVMSAAVGASAAGARAMTASSSAGLALMYEILGIVSGLRLPVVMHIANRAISAPLNIHCDHSDSMGCRDSGWMQIYCETPQEVYENTFLALKVCEHPDVMLPCMVCQDGFITSHGVTGVELLPDSLVKGFIGAYTPKHSLLNIDSPVSFGTLQLQNYLFETKRQEQRAMENALKIYLQAGKELSKITGKKAESYGYFEKYFVDDAKAVIVTLSSTAGTAKVVVDEMRKKGKKVGLLRIKLFRPFPYSEVGEALKKAECIAVLDRAMSFGGNAPVFGEIKNSLYDINPKVKLQSYVFGLGGRNIYEAEIEKVFEEMLAKKADNEIKYIGLR